MVTIDNVHFSIQQICGSGQCFRLEETEEKGIYELVTARGYLKILTEPEQTILCCSQDEFESCWKEYFDLNTCYKDYIERIDRNDTYLQKAAEFGGGIRILRQDIWEMIVTFILSQQNNIPRIRNLIRGLCQRYGKPEITESGREFYPFPDAQVLAEAEERELREMKLGYRSPYICGSARMVASGEIDLEALKKMEYRKAREELMKLPGVGGKVADCICLFALHQLDAFPVDTHIRKALDIHYPEGFPFDRYRGCAGVMQQYIFYYDLRGEYREGGAS